jgi:hypothetical protein
MKKMRKNSENQFMAEKFFCWKSRDLANRGATFRERTRFGKSRYSFCSGSGRYRSPYCTEVRHNRRVLSQLPVNIVRPSGENATPQTSFVCSRKVSSSWPVFGFQSLTVLSLLAEARRRPSGV